MDTGQFLLVVSSTSVAAGALGSLLGLGGGVIMVPVLTLLLGIDIQYAVGASIVSVVATSCGATTARLRDGTTNMRLGMVLEMATATGAVAGALAMAFVGREALYLIFAVVLSFTAVAMVRRRGADQTPSVLRDRWAQGLQLGGRYIDRATGRVVRYGVTGIPLTFGLMFVAGIVSGLLGIGSGVLKVPVMDLVMRLPMKVSTATSNFTIGVTAAAGAAVHFTRGDIVPVVAAPVAIGVLVGVLVGSRLLGRVQSQFVRWLFVVVMIVISLQMAAKGLGIYA